MLTKKLSSVMGILVAALLAVSCGADLPFKNPITLSMMKNNDGADVREIMETLDARGEAGAQVKKMIFHSMLTDLTPLQSAAKYDAADVARALLDHGAPVDLYDEKTESTPLAVAALQGSARVLRLLLDNGADVNHRDKDGRTPLMLASIDGHMRVIEHLISSKADLNLKELKSVPLGLVMRVAEHPITLAACSQGNTALQIAAFYCGDPRLMSFLVAEGAEIDAVDDRKHSAVWLASSAGQVKCVEELLELGADVTLVDREGVDATTRATQKGHLTVATAIREHLRDQAASSASREL